jgi:alpha-1,6-mannosyltransferase
VSLGIDDGVFAPVHRDTRLRAMLLERCGLGEDAMLLLGIGRLAPEKRWPMVIDAALRAGLHRPIGLVMIGEGRDGPKLRRHIGNAPHVHMLAPIRDRALLARVMASGDALIHGCEAETFGLVAAEAAASGLPLIVPSEGGPADLATPTTAETFAPGDAGEAAAAILRLAVRDRDMLHRHAAERAGQIPTMETHFDRLFALYARIAGERRAAA